MQLSNFPIMLKTASLKRTWNNVLLVFIVNIVLQSGKGIYKIYGIFYF